MADDSMDVEKMLDNALDPNHRSPEVRIAKIKQKFSITFLFQHGDADSKENGKGKGRSRSK